MGEQPDARRARHAGGAFLRFVAAGALNTAVCLVLFETLRRVVPYLVSYSLVYGLGILVSYVLNSRYVFSRPLSLRAAVRYPMIYVAQYALGVVLVHLLVERFGVHPTAAFVLAIAFTVPVSFVLARSIIRGAPGRRRGAGDHG